MQHLVSCPEVGRGLQIGGSNTEMANNGLKQGVGRGLQIGGSNTTPCGTQTAESVGRGLQIGMIKLMIS